jgi:hypothetical protein
MFKSHSSAKSAHVIAAGLLCGWALLGVAPPALAEEQAGPVLYSEVENNISVDGAITAATGVKGTAQNNVGVIAGKVRTHAKVTNNIKVRGAITAATGVDGNVQNNVGVITDKSVGTGGGSGGGGLLEQGFNFVKGLF